MVYTGDMPKKKPHAKRFERDPDHRPYMKLTPRDLAILGHVARHRFLNSRQIMELVGKSPRVVRRLELLFRCGYLDRPRAQLVYYAKAGSEPLVYALGRLGAKALAGSPKETHEAHRWTHKNKRVGQVHVQHTIEAADILVRLETETRSRNGVRLVSRTELLDEAPPATRDMTEPLKLSADVSWANRNHRLAVIPDDAFALEFTDGGAVERANFFLELDRETMPVMRRSKSLDRQNRQTSMLSKFLTYHRVWRDKLHTTRFGWENFRVLTVTTSDKRVDSMIEAVKAVTDGRGSSLFLFATASVLKSGDVLSLAWQSGKGELVRLTE
jgi:hypothetical protein